MIKTEYIATGIFIAILVGVAYLIGISYQHEASLTIEQKKDRMRHNSCISKIRGSRPACWDKDDWEAFCQHVECKQ